MNSAPHKFSKCILGNIRLTQLKFMVYYWHVLLFLMKIFLLYSYYNLLTFYDFIGLGSFFIPEFIFIGIIQLFFGLISSKDKIRLKFAIIGILLLITSIIYSLSIISVLKIGFVMNWSTTLCASKSREAVLEIALPEIMPVFYIFGTMCSIFLLGILIIKYYKKEADNIQYDLIDAGFNKERNHRNNADSRKKFKQILFIVYLIISLFIRSDHKSDPDISLNPMIQLGIDFYDYLGHNCIYAKTEFYTDSEHLKWIKECKNLNEAIKQMRTDHQICQKSIDKITNRDFNFVKRTSETPIENIVVIFLESTRTEVMPFNYSSQFAKKWLEKSAFKLRNITPFMDSIINKTIYSTKSKSSSSYTTKAVLAGLCSTYPFPQNFGVEYMYNFYNKCLPEILSKYGNFSTLFAQTLISDFDYFTKTIQKMGFEELYSGETLENGVIENYFNVMRPVDPTKWFETNKSSKLERINMLGYEDELLRKPVMDWIDKQLYLNKSFFLNFCTSATHSNFGIPKNFLKTDFSLSGDTINNYLNSVAYIDHFLERLFKDFESRGLLENTLFLIIGDHGVGLSENNAWYTTDVVYETVFNVPFMIYTENKQFKEKYPPQRIDKSWSSIDVLPTILESLMLGSSKGNFTEFMKKSSYEGQSILHLHKYSEKIQLSLANPGMSAIILRENDMKIILPGVGWRKELIFNINDDPNEENSLKYKLLDTKTKNWVNEMKTIRSLYITLVNDWYKDNS